MTARRRRNICFATLIPAVASLIFVACQPVDRGEPSADEGVGPAEPYIVEVVARDYAFDAPDEVPSGWVTFRLGNEGKEHHFLLLSRLPEGKTVEDYGAEIGAPFDSVWHALQNGMGKAEAGALLGQLLPGWWTSVTQMGGPGLIAPGGIAEATVKLEPGNYVMECYVKTADGTFHVMLGMARALTVTDEASGAPAPAADLEITLSNDGMAIEGEAAAGEQTVAVHYVEHPEIGLGHDVHLVRLSDDTDLDEVVSWMDWMNVQGLREPAPAPFAGGVEEMPAGRTSYFTVNLTPGRWAWIAESSADKGMVREFTVE